MMMSVVMEALDPKSAVTTIHSVNQGPTYTNLCGHITNVSSMLVSQCDEQVEKIQASSCQGGATPEPCEECADGNYVFQQGAWPVLSTDHADSSISSNNLLCTPRVCHIIKEVTGYKLYCTYTVLPGVPKGSKLY